MTRDAMRDGCDGATDGVDRRELEARLHVKPESLRAALHDAVAELDDPGVSIVRGAWSRAPGAATTWRG